MKSKKSVLPTPDKHALATSEALIELIREEIDLCGGKISFARYMQMVLYSPALGYYAAGSQKFGAAGDFVTAPEISSMFSISLAQQIQQVIAELSQYDDIVILEVGGGSGRMAADILHALDERRSLPQRYLILELSPDLKLRQYQYLHQKVPHLVDRVVWIERLPEQGFRGILVANELIDAMPVHRIGIKDNKIQEYYVTWINGHLEWVIDTVSDVQISEQIASIRASLYEGYSSEVNLMAIAWLNSVASALIQGLVLIIDYGFPRREYYHPQRNMGTLKCHYRHHSHDNPFDYPGLQDITAHVDFTALAETAFNNGLKVAGFTNQCQFLLDCGISEIGQIRMTGDNKEQLLVSQEIQKLTFPHEMGELFKVIGFTKDIDIPLLGFHTRDLRGKL